MASFDFIEAATRAYAFAWDEKKYLARVAFSAVFVKVICDLLIYLMGYEQQFLRQGLFMIPGFVVEALLIVGVIRYFLHGEPVFIWGRPFVPAHPRRALLPYLGSLSRIDCLRAGFAMYMLIVVLSLCFNGLWLDFFMNFEKEVLPEQVSNAQPNAAASILVLTLLAAFVWLYRVLWLYIPLAIGLSIKQFFQLTRGFETSFYMIALSLICAFPLLLLFYLGINVIQHTFSEGSVAFILTGAVMRSMFFVAVTVVQAVAMTVACSELIIGSSRTGS